MGFPIENKESFELLAVGSPFMLDPSWDDVQKKHQTMNNMASMRNGSIETATVIAV